MSLTGALISKLSDDLVLHVFSFLSPIMLGRVSALNKRFAGIGHEDVLWYALLCHELGETRLPPVVNPVAGSGEWRRRYVAWRRLEACKCETRSVKGALEDVPQARFLHRAACPAGRYMYVFGGQGEGGEFNDMWMLDKEIALSDSTAPGSPQRARLKAWHRLTAPEGDAAPQQRQSATLTAVGAQLLMFGGRWGESAFLNDAWVYDTRTSSWECIHESEDMYAPVPATTTPHGQRPCPRWAHSAVRYGRRVLVFGGSAPGRCFNDLHWFDLDKRIWTPVVVEGRAPAQRSGHCACALGAASMFVFGGNTTRNSFNDLWEYRVESNRWRQVKGLGLSPSGRVGHTITAVGSRLLVLGGREYATNQFDTCLHSFDTHTKKWSQVPVQSSTPAADGRSVPVLRTGHSTDAYEGRLLIFGGLREDGSYLGDVTSVNLIEC